PAAGALADRAARAYACICPRPKIGHSSPSIYRTFTGFGSGGRSLLVWSVMSVFLFGGALHRIRRIARDRFAMDLEFVQRSVFAATHHCRFGSSGDVVVGAVGVVPLGPFLGGMGRIKRFETLGVFFCLPIVRAPHSECFGHHSPPCLPV